MFSLSKIYHYFDIFREKTSYSASEVFGLRFVRIYLAILALQNLSLWVFIWLFWRQIGNSLAILHFSVDFGIDLVGDASKLFMIPVLSLFVSLFNLALLFVFVKDRYFKLIANLLLAAAFFVNLFLSLALGPLYWMNFR